MVTLRKTLAPCRSEKLPGSGRRRVNSLHGWWRRIDFLTEELRNRPASVNRLFTSGARSQSSWHAWTNWSQRTASGAEERALLQLRNALLTWCETLICWTRWMLSGRGFTARVGFRMGVPGVGRGVGCTSWYVV